MNDSSNYDKCVEQIKSEKVPQIDVTDKVMQRISQQKSRSGYYSLSRFKRQPVFMISVLLFFGLTITVSASMLPNLEWNGLSVKIIEKQETEQREFVERAPEIVSSGFEFIGNMEQKVSLQEAGELLPFKPLRPQQQPDDSYVIPQGLTYEGVYDFFLTATGEGRIQAHQYLDAGLTQQYQEGEQPLAETFEGNWETVEIAEQWLVMYKPSEVSFDTVALKYLTEEDQVIHLELRGSVAKDELLKLADEYIQREADY